MKAMQKPPATADERVIGIDGLTDQQREGARLAAAGMRGVDIAARLGVTPETVSRWRRKREWIEAVDTILAEARAALSGRIVQLSERALDVLAELMEYKFDKGIPLRAAVAMLNIAGTGRAVSSRATAPETSRAAGEN